MEGIRGLAYAAFVDRVDRLIARIENLELQLEMADRTIDLQTEYIRELRAKVYGNYYDSNIKEIRKLN